MNRTAAIPNNVGLDTDRQLLRSLEHWRPNFTSWWRETGPQAFQEREIWLRSVVAIRAHGWGQYDYVRMPDYHWGLFFAPPVSDRTIPFGDFQGKPVWQEVPGELRGMLKRLIVTQADAEPASVEQQRALGASAPSLDDLRNLFQVNVEEGRHLWAMVHLLHKYFGRDGREEAEGLLQRRSGDPDRPRILSTFNENTDDWLSFFMFTAFTDRDGKYQLAALSESGFDPLARCTRVMMQEEAFHLFVGEYGVNRIVQRSAECTARDPNGDARKHGAIDLPTIQKWINFWFSSSVDLFGSEVSSNAADYFSAGLKGRFHESKRSSDHHALNESYSLTVVENMKLRTLEVPLRNAMNEVLRDEYVADCERACRRWNRTLRERHLDFELYIPSRRFNRSVGTYSALPDVAFDPNGNLIDRDSFEKQRDAWLPTLDDRQYVKSLMVPVLEPGQFARWIAPPAKGLRGKPLEFEYVKVK